LVIDCVDWQVGGGIHTAQKDSEQFGTKPRTLTARASILSTNAATVSDTESHMTITRRSFTFVLPLLAAAPALAAWPGRYITIVHGLGPGGGVDVTARVLGERFSQAFGVPVSVESKPGAASIIAAGLVARSVPDGQIIAVFPSTYAAAVALRRSLPFRPVDDFSMIGQINELPYVIATYRDHPAKSLRDIIDMARSASKPLTYSTPGQGSAQHLLMAWFAKSANIALQHVPFRGGPQALSEVLAKRIDLFVDAPLTLVDHVKTGTLRALAVTTRDRSPWFPGVPTVAEFGFSDFDVRGWMGLVAPAGLPAPVLGRLQAELAEVLREPEVVERFKALGTDARASTPDEFRSRLQADIDRWIKVIADAGIDRI
jgi:tripartite-type tricarboxylate transporter receptor subunit TctC